MCHQFIHFILEYVNVAAVVGRMTDRIRVEASWCELHHPRSAVRCSWTLGKSRWTGGAPLSSCVRKILGIVRNWAGGIGPRRRESRARRRRDGLSTGLRRRDRSLGIQVASTIANVAVLAAEERAKPECRFALGIDEESSFGAVHGALPPFGVPHGPFADGLGRAVQPPIRISTAVISSCSGAHLCCP